MMREDLREFKDFVDVKMFMRDFSFSFGPSVSLTLSNEICKLWIGSVTFGLSKGMGGCDEDGEGAEIFDSIEG